MRAATLFGISATPEGSSMTETIGDESGCDIHTSYGMGCRTWWEALDQDDELWQTGVHRRVPREFTQVWIGRNGE